MATAAPDVPSNAAGFDIEGEVTPLPLLVRQLWDSRGLLTILARKDFYVRYRRAAFGLSWAVALPLIQSVVLAVVFSRVVHVRTGANLAAFVLSGLVGWTYFSSTLSVAATSIVDNSGMSSRIYFPRALLPLVSVVANLYGFAVTVVVLVILCPILGTGLGPRIVLLVPATVLVIAVTSGFALVASALHVYFRDIRYFVTAALVVWFYLTPIFYPRSLATGLLAPVLLANPLTGVVELFRAATVGAAPGLGASVAVSCGWAVGLLVVAARLHRRHNRVFSDLL
ncbi:MAG TPA: ABC transporter permease [Acidimicrobiales bacterium]|nr:ABC transporter permease [Acidimicrobiales bacterium]